MLFHSDFSDGAVLLVAYKKDAALSVGIPPQQRLEEIICPEILRATSAPRFVG